MPNAVIVHDARRRLRPRALARRRSGLAGPRRHGPREGRHHRPDLHLGRDLVGVGQGLRPARPTPKHHVVAVDYGIKRNILRLLADHGCRVTVVPANGDRRGDPRPQAGRRVPLQWPGRPGGDRRICRAGDQGRDRRRRADLRHLPRPPDARPRARRHDDEDASGPSRREPPGEGSDHRQGRDHVDEPRLRGRHEIAARRTSRRRTYRSSTARTAGCG